MKSDHCLIIALLVVLVVIVIYQGGGGWMPKRSGSGGSGSSGGCQGGYDRFSNPWTGHDMVHAALNGSPDAPQALLRQRELIPALARAKAQATPEQLHQAERAAWFAARDVGRRATFNTERMMDVGDLTMQEHDSSPEINWQDNLVDLVADQRMRDNQQKWNSEMQPFTATLMKVDTIDEASVFGLGGPGNAVGLGTFSRSGPTVHNPWQLTEVGPDDFSVMPSGGPVGFKFHG